MELSEARKLARQTANDTGTATYVYLDSLKTKLDYDVAFSVPSFGIKCGESYEPVIKPKKILAPPAISSDFAPTYGSFGSLGSQGFLRAHTEPGDAKND